MHEELIRASETAMREVVKHTRAAFKDYQRTGVVAKSKGARNLVTSLDKENSQILAKYLIESETGFVLWDEESSGKTGTRTVFTDPIDGTNRLALKDPYFSISIGAVEDDEPIFGMVSAPMLYETFVAAKGTSRKKYKNNERVLKLKRPRTENPLFFLDYYTTEPDFQQAKIEIENLLYNHGRIPICNHSAALDMCRIADGSVNGGIFIGSMPWDITAGAAILRNAGGMVFDLDGTEFNPYERGVIAVRSIEVLDVIEKVGVMKVLQQIPKELLKFP